MTDALYERVRAHVAANPGDSVGTIARNLRARVQSVRFVLRMEGFSSALCVNENGREYVGHYLASNVGETRGQAGTASQNHRLLSILADGEWHRSDRLHAAVLCVLHSRVAELRRQGYLVEHRGGGPGAANHHYRLVAVEQVAA